MKIKRAKLPDRLQPTGNLDQFHDRLRTDGYKIIGNGLYAEVWAKDNDDSHVIKVARDDVGYDEYLSYVLANQENPYFPRVFDVKRFKGVKNVWSGGDITVVSMERLTKGGKKAKKQLSKRLHRGAKDATWYTEEQKKAARAMFKTKHEKQLLEVMTALSKTRGWLDLHDGNIMHRGNQLVVIDPAT